MRLKRLHLKDSFRKLQPFEIYFNQSKREEFEPLCLVGPNGSGKSNFLELIVEIFYRVEYEHIFKKSFKDKYTPKSFDFELEYDLYKGKEVFQIKIIGEKNRTKVFHIKEEEARVDYDKNILEDYLPSKIIGYSSGMNDILKNRFNDAESIYFNFIKKNSLEIEREQLIFDNSYEENKFKETCKKRGIPIYLISNLTYLDKDISNLMFFLLYATNNKNSKKVNELISIQDFNGNEFSIKTNIGAEPLYVSREIKKILYDYNEIFNSGYSDNESYYFLLNKSKSTNDLLSSKFKDLKEFIESFRKILGLRKLNNDFINFKTPKISLKNSNEITYDKLSDGQHQFLQILISFVFFNEENTLFLLDEPETHLNPEWRTKFISLLNNIKGKNNPEVLITTHSPFILSDCKGGRVYKFNLDYNENKKQIENLNLETFGTSFDLLYKKFFGISESISKMSENQIDKLLKSNDIKRIKEEIQELGPSFNKTKLIHHLNNLEKNVKKN